MSSQSLSFPRMMIAAPHGRSGKTLVTLGLLRALTRRSIVVQPFKKGPDYIDPGWQSAAARRQSRNLDCFLMNANVMNAVIGRCAQTANLGVIEAAMGLYDGVDVEGTSSSAEVALRTQTPVVLVLDATRMTRTAAALIKGLKDFDERLRFGGVILNRIQGRRHERVTRESIERYTGLPVLGAVPRDERLHLADRHLGLVTRQESAEAEALIEAAATVIEQSVDLDALLAVCCGAPELIYDPEAYPFWDASWGLAVPPDETLAHLKPKIAVVYDEAFHFYYEENLEALRWAGAELIFCDSLRDTALPEGCDGLYIGGGFPESFAETLQVNESFRASVKALAMAGGAVLGECGGLMYLCSSLRVGEESFAMTGVFPYEVVMEKARQGHGYTVIQATNAHPWFSADTQLLGHEHHHSRLEGLDSAVSFAYDNKRGHGIYDHHDGLVFRQTLGSYCHVNAIASPQWAQGFVAAAQRYRKELE